MKNTISKNLRLVFPQWQGGDNPPYYFGAQLLAWLAPAASGAEEVIPVTDPSRDPLASGSLSVDHGMTGRQALVRQLAAAQMAIARHQPETVVVLGGDCLVSLAPFAWLSERYGDRLGVLWVDSHPDVMTPDQFEHAHAHVLGALMGNGDPDLTAVVSRPIAAENIMIAGLHDTTEYEAAFLADHGIATCSPAQVKAGGIEVTNWIKRQGIECLAIHLDLDVLDPKRFRSVLFANPDQKPGEFDGIAEGELSISEVVSLIGAASEVATPVGMTVAEHLPWDALNLKAMLERLPLLGAGVSSGDSV